MKNSKILIFSIALIGFFLDSCDSFVKDVDPLNNQIEDSQLDSEDEISLVLTGLLGKFGETGDQGQGIERIIWRASGYSDEMIQGAILPGAPDHASFVQDFAPDIRFYEGDWADYHSLRFLADDLVERVNRVKSKSGFTDQSIKDRALWWGNFIGGLMRMYLADHWGARPLIGDTPGASITTSEELKNGVYGAFFNSTELHAEARKKFMAALGIDPGDVPNSDKVLMSFVARTYLFDGMYDEAKTAAEQGLQQGDETLEIQHNQKFPNQFWLQSGRTNDQNEFLFSPHPRFIQYVLDDRKEGEIISELTQEDIDNGVVSYSLRGIESGSGEPGNAETQNPRAGLANQNERLPLWEKLIQSSGNAIGPDTQWAAFIEGATCTQDYYRDANDPFILIDWREMELILAEVAINASDNPTALIHINNVRNFHGLDPYTMPQMLAYDNPKGGASQSGIAVKRALTTNKKFTGPMGLLIEERDKTLWMKGTRLADQKRFGLWHLEGNGFYKFYMPIPRSETNVNPNIPK